MQRPDSSAGAMSCLTGIAARKSCDERKADQDRRFGEAVVALSIVDRRLRIVD
jgi:hypothetical protein